jgi:hypothetical protein
MEMLILKILGFVFLIPGILTVFGSRWLVARYGLDKNIGCDFENEMSEEELKQYRVNKAVVNLKMIGMLMALPGFIMIIIAFR